MKRKFGETSQNIMKMMVASQYAVQEWYIVRETHREKITSNKTQALTKSMNMEFG